ncbi:hypothetical protein FA13DRAFT_1733451 [Coprinellus micaceus]|uniref:GST N-terminal domain-containing protein n=1 Tax=Coprinellus micaceus TaxID=71717 RepID=A0A4Y7T8T7_COPMI|nr:hypothetical protein FA13DRAFT_1733451 [Coprinellus micaceus]
MIILYDFSTSLPGKGLSLFVWRVRYVDQYLTPIVRRAHHDYTLSPPYSHRWALNIKGLEHRTEWLKYATIEQQMKELGVPHTKIRPDGTEHYTVPAIHDLSTNTILSDSHNIIEYLDKAYSDTPQLCAVADEAIDDFIKPAFEPNWGLPLSLVDSQWCLRIREILDGLEEESARRYRGNFEREVGMPLRDFLEDKERHELLWTETREAFRKIDAWLKEAEGRRSSEGQWIQGNEVKLPDLSLISARGEDNDVWKRIAGWDGGRWVRLWEQIKPYSIVH